MFYSLNDVIRSNDNTLLEQENHELEFVAMFFISLEVKYILTAVHFVFILWQIEKVVEQFSE